LQPVPQVNGDAVPTMVDSATKIRLLVPQDELAAAGKLHVSRIGIDRDSSRASIGWSW